MMGVMPMPPPSRTLTGVRFSANLSRERHKAGLSQEALAFRAGLHRTEIGLLERGRRVPGLWTIARLAAGLEIPLATLIEGIMEPDESDEGDGPTTPGGGKAPRR
jgi:transcriptional regulator with XRE-family HTH domain